LTRHYKEPVMAASSSFTEGSSVFGGQANLLQALEVMFTTYDPDVVAVHTTCLSETIGDDLNQILQKARDEGKVPKGKHVLHCNTPSYVGSHVTGYANMLMGLVAYFAQRTGVSNYQVNLATGWVEPADMHEIKRLAVEMSANTMMFPDTSGVLDGPLTGSFEMYPAGGTTVPELISAGDAKFTLGIGPLATEEACKKLEYKCKVKYDVCDLPIGIQATDRFLMALSRHAGVKIPPSLTVERGRLLDVAADMTKYLYGKRVALWGDPDQLIPLVEFLLACDMRPVYIVSGTPSRDFDERMKVLLEEKVPEAKYKCGERADMFLMHQWIKQEKVDLLIGNTYGKYIARDENTPFVRMGFPILDRIGHSYFPTVGYTGGLRILERILNAVMDHQDREAPEEKFELVM
ncbi:MAG TPA: nitrogenase component 1, partial [Bacteroidota bacterium]|nr:nitrogenase component 1 [Bacteroidota bacterium]